MCFFLYVIVFLFFSFFSCNLITSLFKVLSCLDQHYSYLQDIKYCKLYISLNKYIVVVVIDLCVYISSWISKNAYCQGKTDLFRPPLFAFFSLKVANLNTECNHCFFSLLLPSFSTPSIFPLLFFYTTLRFLHNGVSEYVSSRKLHCRSACYQTGKVYGCKSKISTTLLLLLWFNFFLGLFSFVLRYGYL